VKANNINYVKESKAKITQGLINMQAPLKHKSRDNGDHITEI